ncbi:hypothetical protein Emed_004961 [Eimeria media]
MIICCMHVSLLLSCVSLTLLLLLSPLNFYCSSNSSSNSSSTSGSNSSSSSSRVWCLSDLDASTRQLLTRGTALTEVLKQKQASPMSIPLQVPPVAAAPARAAAAVGGCVCVLYCGVRGFLDALDPKEINRFEALFVKYIQEQHQALLRTIEQEKQLSEESEATLRAAIDEFLATNEFKKR